MNVFTVLVIIADPKEYVKHTKHYNNQRRGNSSTVEGMTIQRFN